MAPPPRNVVSLEAITKAFAGRRVLDGITAGIAAGERIGVVGVNGGGKTTLLQIIARAEEPDGGRVTHAGTLTVGLLAQQDDLDDAATIREVLVGGRADHEWAGDPRVRDVLDGLIGGVTISRFPRGLDTTIGPLSGGERRRIALARLLLAGPELLLLDEPTNHLDVEGIDWLARHLTARKGALVVVTHDRWFLDEVAIRTWEVADGTLTSFDGGYAAWVLARAERDRLTASAEERRRNLVRKELAWLRRGPPARTTKPRYRVEAANALIADVPPLRDTNELLRFATARLGKRVIDVEDASVALGGRRLLHRATWRIGPGDRVGIVGPNGTGKTTLLALLTGSRSPDSGTVQTGTTVRLAHLSQELEDLDGSRRVLESLGDVRERITDTSGRELTAGQLCDRFGFVGNRQWTRVGDLSGGERRRLQLMRLMMGEPNLLLLDEPTNDLDIDTLTALEDLLDSWGGTLVVVSHDRWFLERVCDDLYTIDPSGTIRHLPGGVDQYVEERHVAQSTSAPASTARAAGGSKGAVVKETRKELARLEREVSRLTTREAELHDALAEHATDYGRVATLDAELRAVTGQREAAEEAWLVLADG